MRDALPSVMGPLKVMLLTPIMKRRAPLLRNPLPLMVTGSAGAPIPPEPSASGPKARVAPLFTVVLPVVAPSTAPSLASGATKVVPPLSTFAPVKVLAPRRTSIPSPLLVIPVPVPLITPVRARTPSFTVMSALLVRAMLAEMMSSPKPDLLMAAVPLLFKTSDPPVPGAMM